MVSSATSARPLRPLRFKILFVRWQKSKTLNRIYETVGSVKCFLRTPMRALGRRAPFRSLGKGFAIVNPQARC